MIYSFMDAFSFHAQRFIFLFVYIFPPYLRPSYWLIFELLWRDFFRFYLLHFGRRVFFTYGPRGSPPAHPGNERLPFTADQWSQDSELVNAWYEMRAWEHEDEDMRDEFFFLLVR